MWLFAQYNRNYWVNKLTRKTTWRDPTPLPSVPPPLTPLALSAEASNRQSLLPLGGSSAPAAAFARPLGAYTPPPAVKLAVPQGPFVTPDPIAPEARKQAINAASSPFAMLAASIRTASSAALQPSAASAGESVPTVVNTQKKAMGLVAMEKTRGALLKGLRTGTPPSQHREPIFRACLRLAVRSCHDLFI